MRPEDARPLVRRDENPAVRFRRLCAELAAIRELYGPKVVGKRGKPVDDPRAFRRLLALAETAKHFNVWMDALKRPALMGRAMTARHVLMVIMVRDLGYTQAEVAEWFDTNQPAVSRSIRSAEQLHAADISAIRGRIGTGVSQE